jgi:hypothetical protein
MVWQRIIGALGELSGTGKKIVRANRFGLRATPVATEILHFA